MNKKFWMVWNEGGSSPRQKHENQKEAETEADRLATKHPDSCFIVLEAIVVFKSKTVERVELVIPF